jgi:hypothetical protein
MPAKRFIDPFELVTRASDLTRLLRFFILLDERMTAAFPRAARMLPESGDPSAKQVRGSTRRHHLHDALASAASDAGLACAMRWTEPASWNYPVAVLGGFSCTVGIVETKYRGAARSLRSRSEYLKQLCQRNEIVNPQSTLFDEETPPEALIPDGSLGGLVVAQYASNQPLKPAGLGFWVPSADLRSAYYIRSLDEIIEMLRIRLSLSRKPQKKRVERKPIRRKNDSGKKA